MLQREKKIVRRILCVLLNVFIKRSDKSDKDRLGFFYELYTI